MNWPGKQLLLAKIKWIKHKSWLSAVLFATVVICFALTFIFTTTFLLVFQPSAFLISTTPSFQIDRHQNSKIIAIYQNQNLKPLLCGSKDYEYTGRSINYEQFCNFNYNTLPELQNRFDVILEAKDSSAKYASVCLLKSSFKVTKEQQVQQNQTEKIRQNSNNFICQRYRVYQSLKIANQLSINQLFFMQITLDLYDNENSYSNHNFQVIFEQERNFLIKFIVKYYLWLSLVISFMTATTISFITSIIGIYLIVNFSHQKDLIDQKENHRKPVESKNNKKFSVYSLHQGMKNKTQ